jgi:ACS family hexuronate transporter-like MFS transporter
MTVLRKIAGEYKWKIVAVLFLATTVNYIDRNVLSFVVRNDDFVRYLLQLPRGTIITELHTRTFNIEYAHIDAYFKAAYATGFLITGWIIDKMGVRIGFAISLLMWSVSAMTQGFITSFRQLGWSRFALGIGEAGNFPSANKTVAEWFISKERSLATGIFNAGCNIGIIVTAIAVPYITLQYGWRWTFISTGALGFIVLLLWWWVYKPSPIQTEVTKSESWLQLLNYKAAWAFITAKFLTDPIWWFYLTWLPKFFGENKMLETKLNLTALTLPFTFIYVVSDAGSIFFGWLTNFLAKKNLPVSVARSRVMLLCALCVVPIIFAAFTGSVFVVVILIAIAAAAHQGWSANLYTLASQYFPSQQVASITGLGGIFGAVGGVLLSYNAGAVINALGYWPLFVLAATAYLLAWVLITVLVRKEKSIIE